MAAHAKIYAVATATPEKAYTQQDIIDMQGITDPHISRIYLSTQIDKRYLYLPNGLLGNPESENDLLEKHRHGAIEIGSKAINDAIFSQGLALHDIDFLCVISSTGFVVPSLSAHLIRALNLRPDCQRADIVGMGCNAGLNGLNVVRNWALANPGRNALLLCVEICSAIYVNDNSLRTHVVNSLFGDGAAALLVRADRDDNQLTPHIIDFRSHIITDAIDAMHFDWDEKHGRYSFFLHHSNPYIVGKYIAEPVKEILAAYRLKKYQINHWIVHGGGRNVISAVKFNLDISSHDVRHTTSVLRDYGNISSGSFLFSYQRLLAENLVTKGDHGIFITIGPGAQLETALIKW